MAEPEGRRPIDPEPAAKVEPGSAHPTRVTEGARRPSEEKAGEENAGADEDVDETLAGGLHYPDEENGDER